MNDIGLLKKYFQSNPDVLMAFLFGSYSKGHETAESDMDIAIYLRKNGAKADDIWADVIRIVDREVDLVDMHKAPATLISNVFKTGVQLTIKDKGLYWDVCLQKTLEAEDFYHFLNDYWKIYQKSRSLIPEEKARLLERLQFLKIELDDLEELKQLSFEEYKSDKVKRRNIERWTENILNATIDIAKIVLASEKEKMPKTYEQALFNFTMHILNNENEATCFSHFSNLRNLLAHEYLDVLYPRIQAFIKKAPNVYPKIFEFLEKYLEGD